MTKKIAIIEDDPDWVKVSSRLVKCADFTVAVTANNGKEGLKVIKNTRSDLLGTELCAKTKYDDNSKQTLIVLISGKMIAWRIWLLALN